MTRTSLRESYSNGWRLLTLVLLATVLALVYSHLHPEVLTPGPALYHPYSINKDHEVGARGGDSGLVRWLSG